MTASVVGIATFGIALCKQVLEVYDSFKHSSENLRFLCESTSALSDTFGLIRSVLQESPETNDTVSQRLLVCEKGLKSLEKKLAKIKERSCNPQTLHLRIRLRYAFQEKTINKLKRLIIDGQLKHLELVLVTLNL